MLNLLTTLLFGQFRIDFNMLNIDKLKIGVKYLNVVLFKNYTLFGFFLMLPKMRSLNS